MALQRNLFHITTDGGATADALQAQLVTRTAAVPPTEADLFAIETFVHSYDPVQARAWIAHAMNPQVPVYTPASIAARLQGRTVPVERRAALDVPFDPNAKRADGVAPAGRTRANKLRLLGILGVTDGMTRADALARLQPVRAWRAMDEADRLTLRLQVEAMAPNARVDLATLAPEIPPPWERVAAVIDGLSPDDQAAVAFEMFVGVQKFMRSVNICHPAFLALRRVHERCWGYYEFASDEYIRGMPANIIRDLVMGSQPAPYRIGWWRVELAGWQQALYGTRYGSWAPGDLIFGLTSAFNGAHIGCYQADANANVIFPNNCQAPTGEAHRVWFQADATLSGGSSPTWAELLQRTRGRDVDFHESIGEGDAKIIPFAEPGWTSPYFNASMPLVGRRRLWAVPPLEWYWRMYFAPQSEFQGQSFAEWALGLGAEALIRQVRRENTQRNLRTAAVFGTMIEGLIGRAQVEAAQAHLQNERRSLQNEQLVGQIGGSIATAAGATGVGAWVGLIAGAATVATVGLMRLFTQNMPDVRVDVYGAMSPVFSQFAIYGDKNRFSAVSTQQIGMPAAPSMASALARATTDAAMFLVRLPEGFVRIEGMPHHGEVWVDGERTDDARSSWADATMSTWIVPVPQGSRRVTVRAPSGEGRTQVVQVARDAPTDLAWSRMPTEAAYQVVTADNKTAVEPPSAPSNGAWRWIAALLALLGLGAGAYYLAARRPKRNRRVVRVRNRRRR